MKLIPIKTNEILFYRKLLEVLKSLPPLNKLRPRELDVFSQILFYTNKYKDLDSVARTILVFSKEIKKEMRDNLGIDENIFNNNIHGLKKAKLIDNNNKISSFFNDITFDKTDKEFILQFKFINNDLSGK